VTKAYNVDNLTLEQAIELLSAKSQSGGGGKTRKARPKIAPKKAAKKKAGKS
jgi:topoisomerase IA-like protein